MQIDIITTFPDLVNHFFQFSIPKRAIEKKLVVVNVHNLRDYATDKHKKTDDYPYSGEAGMVMMIEPVDNCIRYLKTKTIYDEIIYTSPDGEKFNQSIANQYSLYNNIILLCGHYKGIDQRIRDYLITKEISIGDYVLSGGEIPSLIISDAIIRLIPGVISDETSALSDSFQNNLLSAPVYTRPATYNTWKVPKILLSGNTKKIEEWKLDKSIEKTKTKRPDLLE
ncbi:MAG: tRNA (guanosine(37)-N1)-methyltransferase TrmD [Bacteroidetes bacterium GWE2_29_8]|nr:MAG: tRNA (guanosine(37)-N1)-methyltransferase TrmD [Bacteroidetes bacterium GWE2_29_8]